jgi:hypothetical protein
MNLEKAMINPNRVHHFARLGAAALCLGVLSLAGIPTLLPKARAENPAAGSAEEQIKAVFAGLRDASAKDDQKGVVSYLAPETVRSLAANQALAGIHWMRYGSKKEQLEKFLAEHGITKENTKDVDLALEAKTREAMDAGQRKARAAVRGLIKDPEAFFVEFPTVFSAAVGRPFYTQKFLSSPLTTSSRTATTTKSTGPTTTSKGPGDEAAKKTSSGAAPTEWTLNELKVQGDKATGVAHQKGTNLDYPVQFVKVDGKWRIVPPGFIGY